MCMFNYQQHTEGIGPEWSTYVQITRLCLSRSRTSSLWETIRRANHLVMRNHTESLNNKTTRHQGNTLQESTLKNSCVNMCQCVFQIVLNLEQHTLRQYGLHFAMFHHEHPCSRVSKVCGPVNLNFLQRQPGQLMKQGS